MRLDLLGPVRRALAAGRASPVALGLVLLLWAVGAATGGLLAGPASPAGAGLPGLVAGAWWSPLAGLVRCADLVSYLVTTVVLVVVLAPVERRIGSRRTLVLLLAVQVVGTAAAAGLVAAAAWAGSGWAQQLATGSAVGPAGAALGVALAGSARLGALWRRRLRLVLLTALVMAALYSGSWSDVLRLAAGLTGLVLGVVPGVSAPGRVPRTRHLAATGQETRVLLALVVAASAVGPLLAAVSGTAVGPLSVLRYLVLDPAPDPATVQAVCATPTLVEDCADLRFRVRLGGLGPAVLSLVPVLLLVVVADGLRRGRRSAWWGALVLNLLFAVLGAVLAAVIAVVPEEQLVVFGAAGARGELRAGLVAAVVQPLVVVVLLVLARRRFTADAPAGTHRGWTGVLLATLAGTAVVYVVGGYLVRDGFTPSPGWGELLADLPARYLPPGYLGQVEIAFLPVSFPATVLYEWTGVVFWGVAVGAALRVLRRPPAATDDAAAVRALLHRHGGSTLAWLATWSGQRHWLDPDRRAAVAYRVVGRVALTSGEPVGSPEARAAALAGFAGFCAHHGWIPCFYGVTPATRDHAEELGWSTVQIAEETLVHLPDLAFTGRRWQDVRSALNNARRSGISAEWVDYGRAPRAVTDQVRAISEEWVADQGLPEMGFTLGGLDELADPQVRCLIAVDADRTVHGVTSWLPVHADGEVIGWTLDFMRRRSDGFRPVMEFLIATAAERFKQEGARVLSLSGAPLARLDRGAEPDALQRVLDRLGEVLEPAYGFRSLLAFKAKFQPEYRPLYLAFPDPLALPAVAAAVLRAYLPDLTPIGALGALHRLHRLRRHPRRGAARSSAPVARDGGR